jgi:hypothetical protein
MAGASSKRAEREQAAARWQPTTSSEPGTWTAHLTAAAILETGLEDLAEAQAVPGCSVRKVFLASRVTAFLVAQLVRDPGSPREDQSSNLLTHSGKPANTS